VRLEGKTSESTVERLFEVCADCALFATKKCAGKRTTKPSSPLSCPDFLSLHNSPLKKVEKREESGEEQERRMEREMEAGIVKAESAER